MKHKIGLVATILILFGSMTSLAQSKDLGFVLGGGLGIHTFSKTDDTRKSTSNYVNDEITALSGAQIYAEYFFLSFMSLGLKTQSMSGGVDYIYSDYTVERRVQLDNSIVYANFLFPVGSGYWRLGGTGGLGSSTYTMSSTVKCDSGASGCSNSKTEKTANGTVVDLGFIADWGEDASGGRIGLISSNTTHEKIDETEIDASGSQLFVDFRYAF